MLHLNIYLYILSAFNNSLSFLKKNFSPSSTSIHTPLEETLHRKTPTLNNWRNTTHNHSLLPPFTSFSFLWFPHRSSSYNCNSQFTRFPHITRTRPSPTPPPPRYLCPQPSPLFSSCFEKRKDTASQDKPANSSKHHHRRILSAIVAFVQSHAFSSPLKKNLALQLPFPEWISTRAEKEEKKRKEKGENCDMISKSLPFQPFAIDMKIGPHNHHTKNKKKTVKQSQKNPRSDL